MANTNFYCQNACGEEDFSIDEWNRIREELEVTDMTQKQKWDILFPEACAQQCFDCMAIVGERRLKTKKLMDDGTNIR